jgi:hypothetical protein
VPDDFNPDYVLSSAELVTELPDTAARYVRSLAVGDDATAASELGDLSRLCEEKASWSQDRDPG